MLTTTWNWTFSVCIHYYPPIPQELYTNIQLYWWKIWQGAFGKDFSFRTDFPARRFWGSCSIVCMAPTLLQTISVAKKASWLHHLFSFSYHLVSFLWWEKSRIVCLSHIKYSHTAFYPSSNRFIGKTHNGINVSKNGPKQWFLVFFFFWIFNDSSGEVGGMYSKRKLSKALISLAAFHRCLVEKHCPKSLNHRG